MMKWSINEWTQVPHHCPSYQTPTETVERFILPFAKTSRFFSNYFLSFFPTFFWIRSNKKKHECQVAHIHTLNGYIRIFSFDAYNQQKRVVQHLVLKKSAWIRFVFSLSHSLSLDVVQFPVVAIKYTWNGGFLLPFVSLPTLNVGCVNRRCNGRKREHKQQQK